MNNSKIKFNNHYDIVYYNNSNQISDNEDSDVSESSIKLNDKSKNILKYKSQHRLVNNESIFKGLIQKNNDSLNTFNLNQQFYSICNSLNIKRSNPIYGMLLTIIKNKVFEEFPFNELKIIIGALYYIYTVTRCSYNYTLNNINSLVKNEDKHTETLNLYVEIFAKTLKIEEITENEANYGVRKVLNTLLTYLTENDNNIDFSLEDLYNLKENGEEDKGEVNKEYEDENKDNWNVLKGGGEVKVARSKGLAEESSMTQQLNGVLLKDITSNYEEIINASMKLFEIIKSNSLERLVMERGRISGLTYRKYLIPAIIFISASAHDVQMKARFIVDVLNLELRKYLCYSKWIVSGLKRILTERYRYKVYDANLFLKIIKSLKNKKRALNEVYSDYNKEEDEVEVKGMDKNGVYVDRVSIKSEKLSELLFNNESELQKRLINEKIDHVINYIGQNLEDGKSKGVLRMDREEIYFTKKNIERYEEIMNEVNGSFKKCKYTDFSSFIKITPREFELIYKLVRAYRRNVLKLSVKLINIADVNEFIKHKNEVNLTNYSINKFFISSIVLIAMRAVKIPISARLLFLFVKEPEGSFYTSLKRTMMLLWKILNQNSDSKVVTMEQFLSKIIKVTNFEELVLDKNKLSKLGKK